MYCNCLLTRLLTSHFFIYDQVKKKVMMKVHIFWEWKELLRWKKSILHHFYGAFNEVKNEKFFGRWESDFKENIQPHSTPNPTPTFPIPPDQILLRLWNKTFLREIYRNMQTFAFKVFQECSPCGSRNVQCKCFFWHQTETFLVKNLQIEKGFWQCLGSISFSMSSEMSFAIWVRFFEQNCIVK